MQRVAAKTLHVVDSSVNLVLDAPLRVTGADASVHAPPATDPTTGPRPGGASGDEEAPHDSRSGVLPLCVVRMSREAAVMLLKEIRSQILSCPI